MVKQMACSSLIPNWGFWLYLFYPAVYFLGISDAIIASSMRYVGI